MSGIVKDSLRVAVRDRPDDFEFEEGVIASALFVFMSIGWFSIAALGIYGGTYAWETGLISTATANLLAEVVHWGIGGALVVSMALTFTSIAKCLWWLHANPLDEVSDR